MTKSLQGFGVISYNNQEGNTTRRVFNCNTNVYIGAQLLLKKLNIQMLGNTGLPSDVVTEKDTYSVSAFAVGGDDGSTNGSDTSLHKLFAIRGHNDDLSDVDAGVQYLAGTYDVDHEYTNENGDNVTLVATSNLDSSTNKDNDSDYKTNYYWKKIKSVDYVAQNSVKYTLDLADKDVQDLTLADVSDTNLTISEFGIYICDWDNDNSQVVDNTDSENHAKILLARLTDSYIKTQNSSIVVEWTIGII